MRVLFLDDNDKRIALARENFKDDDLFVVKSADECIELLGVNESIGKDFDLVMLDHDLGGESNGWGAGSEKTGMDVVNWIVENKPSIKRVVVHSWNPVATYMVDKLWRHGYKAKWKRFSIMQ